MSPLKLLLLSRLSLQKNHKGLPPNFILALVMDNKAEEKADKRIILIYMYTYFIILFYLFFIFWQGESS